MSVTPLIVEDGTMVAGANSYASVAMLRQYALDHGVTTLPVDDTDATIKLYDARDYIEVKEWRFASIRLSAALAASNATIVPQALSFPRYPDYSIPAKLIEAQCQLACDLSTGTDAFATPGTSGDNIKKKVVGPITTEFFAPTASAPAFPKADALLRSLYARGALGFATMRA